MSGEPMRIPAGGLIYKEATVKGFWGSKVSRAMAVEDKRRLVGELLKRAASGELTLPVEQIFALDDIARQRRPVLGRDAMARCCCGRDARHWIRRRRAPPSSQWIMSTSSLLKKESR